MNSLRLLAGFAFVGGALLLNQMVTGQSVPAALNIAQSPLFLKSAVPPAFIMAVDDSGSMNLETLFATNDGELYWGSGGFFPGGTIRADTGALGYGTLFAFNDSPRREDLRLPPITYFGVARSHEFNPGYYNPNSTYVPWKKAVAPHWPDAVKTAAQTEPRAGTTRQVFDLTAPVTANSSSFRFPFKAGMTVPSGTKYFRENGTCNFGGGNNSWNTLAADVNVGADCSAAIEYFPATYYLSTATPPDGYSGTPLQITNPPGGKPGTLYRYEIKPGNYPGDGVAYGKAIQNFANWFQYYRNRRLAAVAAMTAALDNQRDMRVGYFQINDHATADANMQMRDLNDATARANLYTSITSLSYPPVGAQGTPNRQAVARIGALFNRTTDAPVQKACQINAGMLFTDGYSNAGGSATTPGDNNMGAPFADTHNNTMADIVANYYLQPASGSQNTLRGSTFSENKVPVPDGCAATPLDKQLDCRDDLHMNFYGIALGALARLYGNAPYVDNPATTDVDEATNAAFTNPPAWASAGADNPEAVDEIWHAAINGRGKFVNSATPLGVGQAMKNILEDVANRERPSGSQSVAGARLNAGSFNVEPKFFRRNNAKDWFSELAAYRINPANGDNNGLLWEASNLIPAASSRNIWTATADVTSTSRPVVAFNGTNLTAAQIGVSAADLAAYGGATAQNVFDYLRGDPTLEGTKLRRRTNRLGDIVNSAPEIASPKDDYGWGVASGLSTTLRNSYATYLTANVPAGKKNRDSYVYAGANDGMLHAFNAKTVACTFGGKPSVCADPGVSGVEAFAYIPAGVRGQVGKLANPNYSHQYFVDGGIAISDVHNGTNWRTVLVGAAGAGGRSVFGLNVSNPASFSGGDVLWELTSASEPDLGYVLGKPVVVPLDSGQWVALIPNGYNSATSDPALFVVDVNTGAVIKKLKPADNDNTNANGLGNLAAIDSDNDGLVDTVYGGDLQGNLWKFDLNGAVAAWNVALSGNPLFVAKAPDGTRQPITGGIEVSAGPGVGLSVFFGTGRYFVSGDNNPGSTPQIQSLYGIWDNGSAVPDPASGRSSLIVVQAITSQANGPPKSRNTSSSAVDYSTKRGWLLDLAWDTSVPANGAQEGERSIGTPRLQNGKVFFTSFQPLNDECDPDGTNWLYSLNTITGAAAMGQVSLDPSLTPPVCGTDCGGIALSTGGPVRETSVLTPPPELLPGLPGGCIPGSPGCTVPAAPPIQRCTIVIRASGAVPLYLPRPCGRQSWRQVR